MSSKNLTDATISDVFYTSKIAFFAIFSMCFHLAGVLGFWDFAGPIGLKNADGFISNRES